MVELFLHGARPPAGTRSGRRWFPDAAGALEALGSSSAPEVVLCRDEVFAGLAAEAPSGRDQYDLIHCGPLLGGAGAFATLRLTSFNWFFLEPDSERPTISWRATPDLCWVRPDVVRLLGGLDPAYLSPAGRLMDLAYRLLRAGGRPRHDPEWIGPRREVPQRVEVPLEDELVFIRRHLGLQAAAYAAAWQALRTGSAFRVLRALRRALDRTRSSAAPRWRPGIERNLRLFGEAPRQKVGSVSAIIPTIDRYAYLPGAIDSLLAQSPPPDEIVVVDQTPLDRRQPELYQRYRDQPVSVLFLDEPGQSRSRNAAIEAARGEWCLLFEDDAVAWKDLLTAHVRAVERSGAAASTGVSLAPWKSREDIPERNRRYFLADVLATGNSLVRREALLAVGGLDLAFDRGAGADHDLGMRLHLSGHEIVFNPDAIETHFKAPTGGMRMHGAWWRTRSSGFWAAYPPPTQIYTTRQFYEPDAWKPLYLLLFLKASQHHRWWELLWLWASAPWKLARSLRAARRLETRLGWPVRGTGA